MGLDSFLTAFWVVAKETCHSITKDPETKKEIKRHLPGTLLAIETGLEA